MKNFFNTEAMFFPGFYESPLENSDMTYEEVESFIDDLKDRHPKLEIDRDYDIIEDIKGYEEEVAEAWARAYATYFPEGLVKSCEFDSIVPPRNTGYGPDYRFGTDKLYLNIELADDWLERMKKFIYDNQEWFEKRICDDWSSRDGFMSYMENSLAGWLKNLEEEDERYIGTTLAYMMLKKHGEFWDAINDDVWSMVSYYSYISLTPEKERELESLIEEEERELKAKELNEKYQLKLDFPQECQ